MLLGMSKSAPRGMLVEGDTGATCVVGCSWDRRCGGKMDVGHEERSHLAVAVHAHHTLPEEPLQEGVWEIRFLLKPCKCCVVVCVEVG